MLYHSLWKAFWGVVESRRSMRVGFCSVFVLAFFCGCLTVTEYVCQDGRTVQNPMDCSGNAVKNTSESASLCVGLPEEEVVQCLMEAAADSKDMALCRRLAGGSEVTCEAVVLSDLRVCERMPVGERVIECRQTVAALNRGRGSLNCSGRSGEDLVWCQVYGASSREECLLIDEGRYRDESFFCMARATGDRGRCSGISDDVMRGLCERTVSGD